MASMRISVSDPDRIPELLSFLGKRPDVVAERVDGTQIAVSLLGSRTVDANANELEQRLQPWRAANSDVRVELLELP
jgi:hypothetical protein